MANERKNIRRVYVDDQGRKTYKVMNAPSNYALKTGTHKDEFGREYTEEEHNPNMTSQMVRGLAPTALTTGLAAIGGTGAGAATRGQAVGEGVAAGVSGAANIAANRLQAKHPQSKVAAAGAGAMVTGADAARQAYRQEQRRTGSAAAGLQSGAMAGLAGAAQGAISAVPGGRSVGYGLKQGLGSAAAAAKQGNWGGAIANFFSGTARGALQSPTLTSDLKNIFKKSKPTDYAGGTWGQQTPKVEDVEKNTKGTQPPAEPAENGTEEEQKTQQNTEGQQSEGTQKAPTTEGAPEGEQAQEGQPKQEGAKPEGEGEAKPEGEAEGAKPEGEGEDVQEGEAPTQPEGEQPEGAQGGGAEPEQKNIPTQVNVSKVGGVGSFGGGIGGSTGVGNTQSAQLYGQPVAQGGLQPRTTGQSAAPTSFGAMPQTPSFSPQLQSGQGVTGGVPQFAQQGGVAGLQTAPPSVPSMTITPQASAAVAQIQYDPADPLKMDISKTQDMTTEQMEQYLRDLQAYSDKQLQTRMSTVDNSAAGQLARAAQQKGMSLADAEKFMPSDYYLKHTDNQGKFKQIFRPETIAGRQPALKKSDFSDKDNHIVHEQTGGAYVHTPFGYLRVGGGGTGHKNDKEYIANYRNIQTLLDTGNIEGAKKIYEALPREDRGIAITRKESVRRAHEGIEKTKQDLIRAASNPKASAQSVDDIMQTARNKFLALHDKTKSYTKGGVESPQQKMQELWDLGQKIYKTKQKSQSSLQRFLSGGGGLGDL